MATVKARTAVAGAAHMVSGAGQADIGSEIILAGGAAQPSAAKMPTHPVGLALVAATRHDLLGFGHQVVVGRVGSVGNGPAGVAHGEMVAVGLGAICCASREQDITRPVSSATLLMRKKVYFTNEIEIRKW